MQFRNLGAAELGDSSLGYLTRPQWRCQQGPRRLWMGLGLRDLLQRWFSHRVLAVDRGLCFSLWRSLWLLECPHSMVVGLPQSGQSKKEKDKSHNVIYEHHFHSILLVTQVSPIQNGRRLHEGVNIRCQRSLRAPLVAGCHAPTTPRTELCTWIFRQSTATLTQVSELQWFPPLPLLLVGGHPETPSSSISGTHFTHTHTQNCDLRSHVHLTNISWGLLHAKQYPEVNKIESVLRSLYSTGGGR